MEKDLIVASFAQKILLRGKDTKYSIKVNLQ